MLAQTSSLKQRLVIQLSGLKALQRQVIANAALDLIQL